MVDYGLKDRVAIITGANNPWGIGAATALAFAQQGAKVVLVYKRVRRPFDPADCVAGKLQEHNADYMVLESDISDEAAVKALYASVMERFGRVDILVNNAATDEETGLDTIEKITQTVIDDTFAVNVRRSSLMTRELIRHRGDYGRVINLSTDAA